MMGNYGANVGAQSSGFASEPPPTADSSAATVMCNCANQAVLRTVQKDGPNKARQFYTCPKPREEQCGFFEWADDMPSSSARYQAPSAAQKRGSGSSSSGRGAGTTGGWSGAAEGKRKRAPPTCSVCRVQGHTKRTCPQAGEN